LYPNNEESNELIPIYRSYNQQEIVLIKTILDSTGIRYYIRNEIITMAL